MIMIMVDTSLAFQNQLEVAINILFLIAHSAKNHRDVKKVGTSQNFCLAFLMNLKNNYLLKKTVEVGQ